MIDTILTGLSLQGWRWSFYISAMPGVLLGFLILVSVKEPQRKAAVSGQQEEGETTVKFTFSNPPPPLLVAMY